jgi:hypothetical protein
LVDWVQLHNNTDRQTSIVFPRVFGYFVGDLFVGVSTAEGSDGEWC